MKDKHKVHDEDIRKYMLGLNNTVHDTKVGRKENLQHTDWKSEISKLKKSL